MGSDLTGAPKAKKNPAVIRHPPGHPRREVLIAILDASIVLVFELIIFAVRIRIAAVPEGLDELLALFFVGELHKRLALLIADDPAHVLVEPLLVVRTELLLHRLGVCLLA